MQAVGQRTTPSQRRSALAGFIEADDTLQYFWDVPTAMSVYTGVLRRHGSIPDVLVSWAADRIDLPVTDLLAEFAR